MEWVKSKEYIKYLSDKQEYTTSVPYWMHNNILLDITFWMHNNLKVIIKIFSTIYLYHARLFPSIPLEGIPTVSPVTVGTMSIGSTKLDFFP